MSGHSFRAAIFGCGHIGEKHAAGYRWADLPIEAVADIHPESADRLAQTYGAAETFTDYRDLLRSVKPDIVSICTWPLLHEEMALAAVEAGVRAIACEKPLAVNLGAADRIIDACTSAGVLLVVGHQRRYEEHWVVGKQLIADGAIGEVQRLVLSQGGDILSDGVHGINMSLFLTGDPDVEWVLGQADRSQHPAERYIRDKEREAVTGNFGQMQPGWRYGHCVEDNVTYTARFSNGVHLNAEHGAIHREKPYITIVAVGTEGQLVIDTGSALRMINKDGLITRQYPPEYQDESFGKEMRDIVSVLEGALTSHPLDVTHHRKTLEVAMAAFESSRLRRRIALPLETTESPLEAMVASGEI